MLARVLIVVIALIDLARGCAHRLRIPLPLSHPAGGHASARAGRFWRRRCFAPLLADLFDPFRFTVAIALPQDILVFTSLAGTGLFAYEVTRSRRRETENSAARGTANRGRAPGGRRAAGISDRQQPRGDPDHDRGL